MVQRQRAIGLASGSLWLGAAGVGYAIWAMIAIHAEGTMWPLAALFALGVGVVAIGIGEIRGALRLPRPAQEDKDEGKRIRRRFLLVVALEVAAIVAANSVLMATHHYPLIVAIDLMIVGIHFFPLASLFRVPRYNLMGLLFCAIPVVTVLVLPIQAHMGNALSWFVAPTLGCAAVALVFAAAGFHEAKGLLRAARHA